MSSRFAVAFVFVGEVRREAGGIGLGWIGLDLTELGLPMQGDKI